MGMCASSKKQYSTNKSDSECTDCSNDERTFNNVKILEYNTTSKNYIQRSKNIYFQEDEAPNYYTIIRKLQQGLDRNKFAFYYSDTLSLSRDINKEIKIGKNYEYKISHKFIIYPIITMSFGFFQLNKYRDITFKEKKIDINEYTCECIPRIMNKLSKQLKGVNELVSIEKFDLNCYDIVKGYVHLLDRQGAPKEIELLIATYLSDKWNAGLQTDPRDEKMRLHSNKKSTFYGYGCVPNDILLIKYK